MPFSVIAWGASVAAVAACAGVAWLEDNWRRREGLDLGFASHGGMWGDLVLLPVANALIWPHIAFGPELGFGLIAAALVSVWLHARWHGGHMSGVRDHMWPSRPHGRWSRDLSRAGWLHVIYVSGELGLITAWAVSPMPPAVVMLVAAILTVHVPLGLLQPGWLATGHPPRSATTLLAGTLVLLWATVIVKAGIP